MKQLLLDIQPAPPSSLENFVVGRNAEAVDSLKSVIGCRSGVRFIYLWGPDGSGKTHLLQACSRLAARLGVPLTVADDVHAYPDSEQIALFNIFNKLREDPAAGLLIAAGIASPMQMGLRDDLATRLAWGLVYHLHPLSDEEKAQALRTHASERGMKLPEEVIDYCLRHLRRDLPTLVATLDALDVWSLTAKKPVTVPMLRQLLQQR
ncbi:DnaA regulatory inactivator Hda [Methylophilaceae bacterium]|nr:DnaA regulatory inactivator Hda [Methylophilaceae bacterium]